MKRPGLSVYISLFSGRVFCAVVFCSAMFCTTVVMAGTAHAEENPPGLVVDMDRVFKDSIAGKAALANFDNSSVNSLALATNDFDLPVEVFP